MRLWRADLHVHTCLSPCAELSMGPRTILAQAAARGLDLIGITDHNSAENVPAVVRAAESSAVKVLPGMEVTSREEVHLLGLFDRIEAVLAFQELVYRHLHGSNRPELFGLQVVVNEEHEVLGFNPRLLAGATELAVEEVASGIHRFGGLVVAAHADREAFGVLGHLGFLPPGLAVDALELTGDTAEEQLRRRWPDLSLLAVVCGSDAHAPGQIGAAFTEFATETISVVELRKALRGEDGRRVIRCRRARESV